MNPDSYIQDFLKVASLAGINLDESVFAVQHLPAPHRPLGLPLGKMGVYVFTLGETTLKVGKAGPNSDARYRSQHYNPASAASTLAASLLKGGENIGVSGLSQDNVGAWIKANTSRTNFLLSAEVGVPVLSLLESFLQCRLKPVFEGFASQRVT
jgi:hypothetical protein